MKKIIAVLFMVVIMISIFIGCNLAKENKDQNTLTLMYGRSIPEKFIEGLQAKFPEINFELEFYQGANYTEYAYQSLVHGEASDIFVYSLCLNEEDTKKYLIDLSGYQFLGNFDNAMLDTMAKGGRVYQLPGPVSSRCILYNKTLFEMNGWKVPTTFNELLETVKQIRKDAPEITPIAMGTVATGYTFTIVSSFAQCGFLSTPEGSEWEKNYFKGEASLAEGFNEGLTIVEKLIDANAFDAEKYIKIWNVVGGDPCERKAAMSIVLSGTQAVLPLLEKTATKENYGEYCTDEFGLLPFFGIEDGQQGLSLTLSSTWGINKRLEGKGNEKKLANAIKVMEFLSSEEGQSLLKTDNGQIPTIKNLESTNIHPEVQKLWALNESGKKSIYLYSGYEDIIIDGGQIVMDAMLADSSEGLRENFVKTCDELHAMTVEGKTAGKIYGQLDENLTIDETVQLSMAAVQQKNPVDFTLATYRGINNRVINTNGVGGRFFKGEVNEIVLNIVIQTYNATIETVELTGKEVKMLLQNGKTVVVGEDKGNFKYIAYGLDVVEKDGVITNVKFNGEELDDNKTYVVNFHQGDYDDAFKETHTITNTGLLIFDAIADYLAKYSPITSDKIK